MADITATIASQLQQASQALKPPAPKPPEPKKDEPVADSPSVTLDASLIAKAEGGLSIDEADAPADSGAAKELASAIQPQLAAQTLSIANQSPQQLQGLFR